MTDPKCWMSSGQVRVVPCTTEPETLPEGIEEITDDTLRIWASGRFCDDVSRRLAILLLREREGAAHERACFDRYVQHLHCCPEIKGKGPCDCGLDALMAARNFSRSPEQRELAARPDRSWTRAGSPIDTKV